MALIESGLRYCLAHDGIVQEDEGEPCDFARRGLLDGEGADCVLTPLLYEKRRKRGSKPNAEGCQSRLRGRWGVHAKCWLPAGHEGSEHTNGYRTWTDLGGIPAHRSGGDE